MENVLISIGLNDQNKPFGLLDPISSFQKCQTKIKFVFGVI